MRLPRKDLPIHLTEGLVAHVSLQTKQLKEENKQLKHQVERLINDLWEYRTETVLLCPAEFTMTNFEQHKKDCDQWYSPAFYTHPKGYKMCLLVYAGGNGDGANTHVSVFLYLMKGVCDEQLEWPLRGKFSIQLLNQDGEKARHHTTTITFETDDGYSRVVDGERATIGWGQHLFIAHTELTPKYLRNDCLKFRIKTVD